MPIRGPRVFTIPPGAPFLATLARALLNGELIPELPGEGSPLKLASATIYVPTQRAAAALAEALVAAGGGRSLILPRIAPLGAFEPEAAGLPTAAEESPFPDPLPAVGELARRHALAELAYAWGKALKGAIRGVDEKGRLICDAREPALVATTPAQAYALAADLAALIDDMIIEGIDWRRIQELAPEAYDAYWRITVDFLKIAFAHWPQWLEEHGLIDRAQRVALMVKAEVAGLRGGMRRGPTIIAGSTGANRATAALIAAIARDADGAVVLPGLDLDLDDGAWGLIGGGDEAAQGLASHPQALLHRLIGLIGVKRDEIATLGAAPPGLAARAAYLSEALRPAEATEGWRERTRALSAPAIAAALEDVAIIAADTEAEEALALAIAMREVLETPGKTAALITPDRSIARRVAAELARWGVEVEDSAGRSLGQTEAGTLAQLIIRAAIEMTPLALVSLLAHPAVRLSRSRVDLGRAARALETGVFRAERFRQLLDLDGVFAAARAAIAEPRIHPAIRAIDETRRGEAERLARDLVAALKPLRAIRASPLSDCLAAHRAALEAVLDAPISGGSDLHGLDALIGLMDEWRDAAAGGFACTLSEYAGLMEEALAGVRAPPAESGHPRLKILGLLEARLLSFDRALLAGLDEKVWPPAVETDAFLNRPMRAKLGLSAPERRIGQTAHDFVGALGAREAILSRSGKRGGEPTVASRFLQRMGAAAGDAAIAAAQERGERYLRWARALDRSEKVAPIQPPRPTPAADVRPRSLSVTRVETLRRDPYAIYAERILRLEALEPIERELGAREAGDAWHGALQQFAERYPAGPLPSEAGEVLLGLARSRFALMLEDPGFAGLAWPNIEKAVDFVLDFERRHREGVARILVERRGEIAIPLSDGGEPFRLTARADRIDLLHSGCAALIDYKTGEPPGPKEVKVGFAPQLTLEAAILRRGGFEGIAAIPPASALYL
ncbi:MAG: double-strand break repair protein AddB, partial [Hyphomicrobiales bacterium]|nr:double-strand break repair protein AddB [Hyphomicrobiales bacterium]